MRGLAILALVALAGCEATRDLVSSASDPDQVPGGLAVPSTYPLMRGDETLWQQLTRAEQQRALAFLAAGSTIRSSLRPD